MLRKQNYEMFDVAFFFTKAFEYFELNNDSMNVMQTITLNKSYDLGLIHNLKECLIIVLILVHIFHILRYVQDAKDF